MHFRLHILKQITDKWIAPNCCSFPFIKKNLYLFFYKYKLTNIPILIKKKKKKLWNGDNYLSFDYCHHLCQLWHDISYPLYVRPLVFKRRDKKFFTNNYNYINRIIIYPIRKIKYNQCNNSLSNSYQIKILIANYISYLYIENVEYFYILRIYSTHAFFSSDYFGFDTLVTKYRNFQRHDYFYNEYEYQNVLLVNVSQWQRNSHCAKYHDYKTWRGSFADFLPPPFRNIIT